LTLVTNRQEEKVQKRLAREKARLEQLEAERLAEERRAALREDMEIQIDPAAPAAPMPSVLSLSEVAPTVAAVVVRGVNAGRPLPPSAVVEVVALAEFFFQVGVSNNTRLALIFFGGCEQQHTACSYLFWWV
jgi:hypothetical protein